MRTQKSLEISNLNGGLSDRLDPSIIKENQASHSLNTQIKDGVLGRRFGFKQQLILSNLPADSHVLKLYFYIDINEALILVIQYYDASDADIKTKLIKVEDGTILTTLSRTAVTEHSPSALLSYYGKLLVTDKANLPQYWDGSGWTTINHTFLKGDASALHKDRIWIARISGADYSIYFSRFYDDSGNAVSPLDDAAWTDYNFIKIEDGGPITGIASHGGALIVFKREAIFAITGDAPSNFAVNTISNIYGCIHQDTIAHVKDGLIFRGIDEFYRMSPGGFSIERISAHVAEHIDFPYTQLANLKETDRDLTGAKDAIEVKASADNKWIQIVEDSVPKDANWGNPQWDYHWLTEQTDTKQYLFQRTFVAGSSYTLKKIALCCNVEQTPAQYMRVEVLENGNSLGYVDVEVTELGNFEWHEWKGFNISITEGNTYKIKASFQGGGGQEGEAYFLSTSFTDPEPNVCFVCYQAGYRSSGTYWKTFYLQVFGAIGQVKADTDVPAGTTLKWYYRTKGMGAEEWKDLSLNTDIRVWDFIEIKIEFSTTDDTVTPKVYGIYGGNDSLRFEYSVNTIVGTHPQATSDEENYYLGFKHLDGDYKILVFDDFNIWHLWYSQLIKSPAIYNWDNRLYVGYIDGTDLLVLRMHRDYFIDNDSKAIQLIWQSKVFKFQQYILLKEIYITLNRRKPQTVDAHDTYLNLYFRVDNGSWRTPIKILSKTTDTERETIRVPLPYDLCGKSFQFKLVSVDSDNIVQVPSYQLYGITIIYMPMVPTLPVETIEEAIEGKEKILPET